MISDGLIWFDKNKKYGWTIKSINGVNQEILKMKKLLGGKQIKE